MLELTLLLLPVAAWSGWFAARRHQRKMRKQAARSPASYLSKLSSIWQDPQKDKALDTFLNPTDVNQDTVETHLALASLFRRRGEVDRAIRIHQYLIARTNLSSDQRCQSLYQLGYDYLRAGLFDRAESLFLELADHDAYREQSLRQLVEIYQQQHDWEQAIQVAQQLAAVSHQPMVLSIAHYYCELAEAARDEEDLVRMQEFVQQASRINPASIRANLLSAELAIEQRRYKVALRTYQRVAREHSAFIPAILNSIATCYQHIGREPEYIELIQNCLQQVGSTAAIISVLDKLPQLQADLLEQPSIIRQLQLMPSIWGLQALIRLFKHDKLANSDHLCILQEVVQKIVSDQPLYRCASCGYASMALLWWCPGCKSWETIKPLDAVLCHPR
jgi:lipopolysaccharide biosynthesis regulator YciM